MAKRSGAKRYWRIAGYDSSQRIFETRVELGQFTGSQIKELLRALVAKAELTNDEIVGACAKRRTKIANNLLSVQYDPRHRTYTCGDTVNFAASIVDESNKIIRPPEWMASLKPSPR
jgi:hypothetical protein